MNSRVGHVNSGVGHVPGQPEERQQKRERQKQDRDHEHQYRQQRLANGVLSFGFSSIMFEVDHERNRCKGNAGQRSDGTSPRYTYVIMKTDITPYEKGRRHLARRDPVLKQIIGKVGACTLQTEPDRFWLLVRSIVSQQISGKAARSICARLRETVGRSGITPRGILKLNDEKLRGAGLSTAKMRAVRDLAEKVHAGEVCLDDIHEREDEEIIEHLIPVRGIGRWTAEMFLIFSLGRMDVLPIGDLGLRVGVQRHYGFEEPPPKDKLVEIAEPWRPYRSVATWYFWRSLGPVPQSQ